MLNIFKKLSVIILLMLPVALHADSPLSACPAQKLQAAKELAQLEKQWVYVDFWASWCGPCRETFPFMNELQQRYKDKLNIVAISVDDTAADAQKFLQRYPAQFPTYLDSSGLCPQVFKVRGMPSSYLISPQGRIVFTEVGFKKNSAKDIIKAVDKAMLSR